MKPLVVLFLIVGSALSEIVMPNVKSNVASPSTQKQQYAEAREGGFSSDFSSGDWEPAPYSNAQYAAPYASAPAPSAFGLGGNFNIGFPGLIGTGITVILALLGVTMLIQVVILEAKLVSQLFGVIRELPFVKNLFKPFGGRNLNADQINDMLNFAMDSYEKLQALYED